MGNSVSFSCKNLSDIRQEIIAWISRPYWTHEKAEIPWTKPHLSALLDYVLKLEGITISYFITQCYATQDSDREFESQLNHKKIAKMFTSLAQDLQGLFKMPKLYQSHNKKNELVAAFINFLVQLLYHRTASMNLFKDRVESLEKELRFYITVLGDTALIGADHEQVQHLLAEFEAVANDAGSLVYSFVFLPDRLFRSTRFDRALNSLLKLIHFLNVEIGKSIDLLALITTNAAVILKIVSADSLFNLDSLLDDLQDLMNREGDLTFGYVEDQIGILIQELLLSQPLLKAMTVPSYIEIKELNETITQISDVAYEAEYLVNYFLVGDAPLCDAFFGNYQRCTILGARYGMANNQGINSYQL